MLGSQPERAAPGAVCKPGLSLQRLLRNPSSSRRCKQTLMKLRFKASPLATNCSVGGEVKLFSLGFEAMAIDEVLDVAHRGLVRFLGMLDQFEAGSEFTVQSVR